MEIEEKNFFKKVWTSIKDFEGYEEFAAGKLSKAIKYIAIMTAIFVITIAIAYTYKIYTSLEEIKNYINEHVEEIALKSGELEVKTDKDIVIEDEKSIIPRIIVNTAEEVNEEEYIQKIKAYKAGILFLKEKVVIASSVLNEEQEIYYSTISMTNIEGKDAFLNMISIENLLPICAILFIYLFFGYFLSNIIDAVILGILGNLFARLLKIKLKYKATLNISIYALTLPIILNLIYIIINTFIGFEIQHFQWMYTSISYIYVVVAILMIKTEIMQKRIEMMKIREIQKQVAREAEEIQPEKEKKEEKQEEENKEKEEKNIGEEPEGSKA